MRYTRTVRFRSANTQRSLHRDGKPLK